MVLLVHAIEFALVVWRIGEKRSVRARVLCLRVHVRFGGMEGRMMEM